MYELVSVMLFVRSEILTIHGLLQGTFGFHEPEPTPRGGFNVAAEAVLDRRLSPMKPPFKTRDNARIVTSNRRSNLR